MVGWLARPLELDNKKKNALSMSNNKSGNRGYCSGCRFTLFARQTIHFQFVAWSASTRIASQGIDANMRTFMAASCAVTLVYVWET